METVDIDDVEPGTTDDHRTHDRRVLTEALGTSDLAVVHYELDPGERLSGSLHTHMDQEEVFLVVSGEVTFETRASHGDEGSGEAADGDGAVTVGANEAIRFAPGEYQSGYNDGDEPAEVFALGAPRDSTDVRISHIAGYGDVSCPACGNDNMQVDPGAEDADLTCPACGADWQ